MKKMNNKGYMIVEIIVASVLAMTIAYFLFDLVIKLKEKYDYVQTDTILTTDKTVITNEILGDLYNRDIKCISTSDDTGDSDNIIDTMTYKLSGGTEFSLKYDTDNKKIIYNKNAEGNYTKKLNDKLNVSKTEIKCENDIASFIIEASTLTSKKNYNINIIIPVPSGACDTTCTPT